MLAVIYFVRMPGFKHRITLQTEDGEESGKAMRWQWVYNTKRRGSTTDIAPLQKVLSYTKLPKYVATFPVMNLDSIGSNPEIFFPNNDHSGGGDVITHDPVWIIYICEIGVFSIKYSIGFSIQ